MLAVNTLITWKHDDDAVITERILWLNTNLDIAYVIDIDGDSLPIIRNISEINASIRQGIVYNKVSDKYKRFINEDDLKEKDKINRDKAWEVIKDLVILDQRFLIKGKEELLLRKQQNYIRFIQIL